MVSKKSKIQNNLNLKFKRRAKGTFNPSQLDITSAIQDYLANGGQIKKVETTLYDPNVIQTSFSDLEQYFPPPDEPPTKHD